MEPNRYMCITFPSIDLVTAEKLKAVLTDAVPTGTSYNVYFDDEITTDLDEKL